MIEKIIIFYVVAFSLYALLSIYYKNPISALAFAWFGPVPVEGELYSNFKLRKIIYTFNWLLQFIYLYSLLFLIGSHYEWVESTYVYLAIVFGSAIGFGMALLATIGFSISWLKTKIIGPDGPFIIQVLDDED
ncbi:hypothetical protein [Thalassotalea sp. PS06]|uniref:hypothetical protein n=1 Tax=Thalassotalea sp. PS06 TaxID=2594005 RepID=UPI00116287FF|nr:hypothetical protein [Thalassotalea sp. PS06]QDP00848.1 hypothetical protein FNC98_05490 [Thalassotalea sp. PS06]